MDAYDLEVRCAGFMTTDVALFEYEKSTQRKFTRLRKGQFQYLKASPGK